MRKAKLSDMERGWFIGDFSPSILRSKDFEVGVLSHKRGEPWPKHFHAKATEINVLLEGQMLINGHLIGVGDIFVFEPSEVADPTFLEDCKVLCIKTPSIPGDKYEVF